MSGIPLDKDLLNEMQKLSWGCAPSFSSQVRFGEPRAPVLVLVGSVRRQNPTGFSSLTLSSVFPPLRKTLRLPDRLHGSSSQMRRSGTGWGPN